ncbi:MAG: hypothetical protein IJ528_06280 [Bacteroidaceae bacterium]|nr:hypothetical protein [Bacteroidaceae bacterium]
MSYQSNIYYALGGTTALSSGQEYQQFKYTDKEYDPMHGLNLYDYGNNNPCRYVDPDGKFPFEWIANIFIDIVRNVADWNFNIFHFDWTRTENSLKIDLGMFTGSLGQILNKWTWGLVNSLVGNTIAQGLNLVGAVSGVSEMDGMLAIAGPTGDNNSAFTIGHYSFGPNGYRGTWQDNLFVHEYGHYIQSQQWGPAYIYSIGAPSLVSATIARMNSNYNHSSKWFEIDASTKGAKYFDKKYGPTSSYSNNHDNIFDINVFKNGGYSPYYNPRLGKYFQDKHFIIQ